MKIDQAMICYRRKLLITWLLLLSGVSTAALAKSLFSKNTSVIPFAQEDVKPIDY